MTLVKIAELFFLKNFFFKVFDNFRELKILEEKKLDLESVLKIGKFLNFLFFSIFKIEN